MIKRNTAVLLVLLLLAAASPVRAQFFGVVYDPTNYANAVLRYGQLQQQYAQLVLTYQQIRTQYLLISRKALRLARDEQVLSPDLLVREHELRILLLKLAVAQHGVRVIGGVVDDAEELRADGRRGGEEKEDKKDSCVSFDHGRPPGMRSTSVSRYSGSSRSLER